MIPAGYSFTSLVGEGLPLGLSLTQAPLGNAFLGSNTTANSPAQLFQQAVLQSTLGVTFTPLTSVIGSGAIQSTGQVGILPASLQLSPLTCVNPLALYSSIGTIQGAVNAPGVSASADVDAHTIVRAPVLYKKSPITSDGDEGQSVGTNANASKANKETSPPDRIVASYAAAAHAAALANHQPVSKAAEVFLAATNTGSGRSRHSKRSRSHISAVTHSEVAPKRVAGVSTPSAGSTAPLTESGNSLGPLSGANSDGWRRIVDRISGKVIYIAPDGISLHNTTEVCAYFRTRYPGIVDDKSYEEQITSIFIFEPTTEAPSLDNGLSFIPSTQPTVSSTFSSTTCNNSLTTAVSTTIATSGHSESDNKSSPPLCRIAFNPSVLRSDASNLLGRKPFSNSSAEMQLLSSTLPRPANRSPEHEPLTTAPCIISNSENISESVDNAIKDNDVVGNDGSTNSKEETSKSSDNGVASTITPHFQLKSDNLSSVTDVSSGGNPSVINPVSQSNLVVSRDDHLVLHSSGVTGSDVNTVSTVETTVARMSTETLTTGILNTTIPSCSSTVIPSVLPPVSGNDINLLTLVGLASEPSTLYSGANSEIPTSGLPLNSLLTAPRLVQAQTHAQQQQLSALISALSANSSIPHASYQTPAAVLGTHSQLNPLVLTNTSQYTTPWSAMGSTPVSWSDLSGSTVMSTLSAFHQQQHIVAAAALQQQQVRAAWAAQAAALLQRQQLLVGQQQQQQQQQLALAAAGQVQAYLAALQRNLSIG